MFAGTQNLFDFLLRDSQGIVCTVRHGVRSSMDSTDILSVCCPKDFSKDNDLLSTFLLFHQPARHRGQSTDDWFIDRIQVQRNDFVLLDYRFQAWTSPFTIGMYGVSRVKISSSNNGTSSSYSLIRF